VARRLRVSPRQLQRRLAEEGTSFRELRHALRRSLATSYLEDDRLAIAEVAFLLGFSGSSSFHHAFKRWTGKTPAAFRRR
jgi:AraC-like DNA-binding protein